MDDKRYDNRSQSIILENRQNLSITGVEKVESFNEKIIIALTIKGLITVKGNSMHMSKLNLEDGNLKIEGNIDSLHYSNKSSSSSGKGLLGKMFK